MADGAGAARQVLRAFVPRRSALRRSSDRLEVAARWVVLLVTVALVPFALAAGSEVTARLEPEAAAQQAERHEVNAVVLGVPADDGRAPVRWTAADGTPRTASILVGLDAAPGDGRALWVDRQDRPTLAPMTSDLVAAQGILTALFLIAGDLIVSLVLLVGLRLVLDRWRLRGWEAAWRRFTGPDHQSRH